MFLWNARTNQRHTHVGNGVEFWNLANFSCNESKLFKINLQIYSNKIVSKNLAKKSKQKNKGKQYFLENSLGEVKKFLSKLALKVQKTKLVVKYKWIFTYKSVHDTVIP